MMALLPIAAPPPTRKADMVAAIESHLAGDRLRKLWEALDEMQQLAVSEALHTSLGVFDRHRFKAKYNGLPVGFGTASKRTTASPLHFFLYAPRRHDTRPTIVPPDLAERLRAFVPPPPAAEMPAVEEPPEAVELFVRPGDKQSFVRMELTRRDMERTAQHDLLAVLRLIEGGRVPVSASTRRPSAAACQRVAEVLAGGDFFDATARKAPQWIREIGPIRAFAWPMLLQAAKLAEVHGSKLALTKAGRAALGTRPADTLRLLWRRWLASTAFDEFRRIEAIKGQRGRGARAMTAARSRRGAIAEALMECPVGQWVSCDDLSRYMQAADLEFSITRNPWHLYIGEARYGSLGYSGYHDWSILQGRYLLCFLFEYAATLGVVDVAYTDPDDARLDFSDMDNTDDLAFLSRYDGLRYFRLTPLGAWCLGEADSYQPRTPAAGASITVFPDRRVHLHGEPAADELILLETYARPETDGMWRLDQDRTLAALESGSRVDELREFLTARDDQPLPETVEGFLDAAASRAQALVPQGAALLIECADAALADLLATHERTAKLCQRTGERGLVVRAHAEAKFRKAIRELGYGMPRA
jgi:hypothetical protein